MRTDLAMESMFEELDSSPRANGIHAIHAKTLDSQVEPSRSSNASNRQRPSHHAW